MGFHMEVYISIRDNTVYMSSEEDAGNRRCSKVSLLAVQQMFGNRSMIRPNRVESFAAQCFCSNTKIWSCSTSMWDDIASEESVQKKNYDY